MNDKLQTLMDTPFSTLASESSLILHNLHFIRPDWFYAFIPLLLYLYLYSNRQHDDRNWQSVIDRKLLPFVLTQGSGKRRRYPLLLTFIAASLCITALAGPVYKKLPQPVYREQSSLVVLLDLSSSMNANDIKPSRLARAKLELLDILKARETGQTALIVYAADAFVVTPLTDDNATIANLVPALETSMMPAQGSNLSKALAKTFALFSQAGVVRGDILVITDDIQERDEAAIKKVLSQGHRLSIFGIGTTQGAPIPLLDSAAGGFLKDSKGNIVVPRLQRDKLQRYALLGSGIYTELKADDSDTERLTRLFESTEIADDNNNDQQDLNADVWQEEGHWLLLPLLLLAALWARRGWIAVLLPFFIATLMSAPQPAYAETDTAGEPETAPYLDINNLWSSPDQKAMKAFEAGDAQTAAQQFKRPEWKASAQYRAGEYEAAASTLDQINTSDGYYNKGNALARLGRYQEAIQAYDQALTLDASNEDAKYNREQVQQALQKQQQENRQQDNSDQQQSEQDKSDQQQSEQQKSEQDKSDQNNADEQQSGQEQSEQEDQSGNEQDKQQSGEQQPQDEQQSGSAGKQDSEQQDQEQQDQEQQGQDQKNMDQQQSEEQQLKQRDADAEKKKQQEENQQYQKQQKNPEQDKDDKDTDEKKPSDSVEHKEADNEADKDRQQEVEVNPVEASISEEEKATEQWLKRIPDDPGGLLRRKFLYQYKQLPNQRNTDEPW